jgi:hypothetical protein
MSNRSIPDRTPLYAVVILAASLGIVVSALALLVLVIFFFMKMHEVTRIDRVDDSVSGGSALHSVSRLCLGTPQLHSRKDFSVYEL